MEIKSVNVGKIKHYDWGRGIKSAIHKKAVKATLYLTVTGFESDEQADTKNHGGKDKAVLIIPTENYAFFNIDKPFGFLGETLSISGLDESLLQIGDRLIIEDVILEITQPRSPCAKLGELVGDRYFVKKYSSSGRVGFYCRVIQQGNVLAGSSVKIVKTTEKSVDITTLFLAQYIHDKTVINRENIKIALATTSLSAAWRVKLSKLS